MLARLERIWVPVALGALLVSCGQGGETSSGISSAPALRSAINNTLNASTMHIKSCTAFEGDRRNCYEVDYRAPDQSRLDGTDISIGPITYRLEEALDPNEEPLFPPGSYTKDNLGLGGGVAARFHLVPLEVMLDAERVTQRGDDYVVTGTFTRDDYDEVAPREGVAPKQEEVRFTAELRVRDEHVVRMHYETDEIDEVWEYSRFDARMPSITPPPLDRVVESGASRLQPCEPDGEVPITTGDEVVVACQPEVDLPAPEEPTNSTLQLRLVTSSKPEDCDKSNGNPSPSVDVNLSYRDECLGLERSLLEVTRASVLAPTESDAGVFLDIALESPDADRLDEVAAENVGKRFALVMFGEVLATPVVTGPEFDGKVALEVSKELASRIKTALAT